MKDCVTKPTLKWHCQDISVLVGLNSSSLFFWWWKKLLLLEVLVFCGAKANACRALTPGFTWRHQGLCLGGFTLHSVSFPTEVAVLQQNRGGGGGMCVCECVSVCLESFKAGSFAWTPFDGVSTDFIVFFGWVGAVYGLGDRVRGPDYNLHLCSE